jgi:hypothetical protein
MTTSPPPRVVSVRQPHASAFFWGRPPKTVENRSRPTAYRGLVFIHAAMRDDPNWERSPMRDVLAALPVTATGIHGAIIGLVELVSCTRDSTSPWALPGMWHWQVEPVFPMVEISMRGRLGLWTPDDSWLRRTP